MFLDENECRQLINYSDELEGLSERLELRNHSNLNTLIQNLEYIFEGEVEDGEEPEEVPTNMSHMLRIASAAIDLAQTFSESKHETLRSELLDLAEMSVNLVNDEIEINGWGIG